MNFYQLWLDDLFPRAKFVDGLSIIEKLGHSRRLQTMRREWIDEEKPRLPTDMFEDTLPERSQGSRQTPGNAQIGEPLADLDAPDNEDTNTTVRNGPQEKSRSDEGLFMSDDEGGQQKANRTEPEDDDLDLLLREQEDGDSASNKVLTTPETTDEDGYEDDLEVLREVEGPGTAST